MWWEIAGVVLLTTAIVLVPALWINRRVLSRR